MEVISISARVAQGAHREFAEPAPFVVSEMTFPEVSPELPSALAAGDGTVQTVLGEQSQAVLSDTQQLLCHCCPQSCQGPFMLPLCLTQRKD